MEKEQELFRIGVIASPHGVRGEVKVYPTTDDPMRIKKIKEVYLKTEKETLTLHPQSLKVQNKMIILKFKEFNSMNEVEGLKKLELYVARKDTIPCSKDEYLISDLIGLRIIDEQGQEIGVLREVLPTGANDVYEIERLDGTELLLPAIKQCILEVQIAQGYMRVHVLEGL